MTSTTSSTTVPTTTAATTTTSASHIIKLPREKHIRYWLRCLRTLLPTDYTSTDLNRTSLAYFCVAGLDILGELQTLIKPGERAGWIDWLYLCQVPQPDAGFRGSTSTDFHDSRDPKNARWDPGNLAATFFALSSLIVLGDDLSRVRRKDILLWLRQLQRKDGSFNDMIEEEEDEMMGVRDVRFVYLAASVRWMLRGKACDVEDIDVDAAVRFISSAQNYDGGYAAAPYLESHAGHAFCAIAALHLLDRLDTSTTTPSSQSTISWLVSRQNPLSREDQDDYDSEEEEGEEGQKDSITAQTSSTSPPIPTFPPSLTHNGFNGRCNKRTDTCYSFWVAGTLDILDKSSLINATSNRQFLLEKTGHIIGGFGKNVGSPPDVMHSCLGLAALAIYSQEDDGLSRLDSALCVTRRAKEGLMSRDWWSGTRV